MAEDHPEARHTVTNPNRLNGGNEKTPRVEHTQAAKVPDLAPAPSPTSTPGTSGEPTWDQVATLSAPPPIHLQHILTTVRCKKPPRLAQSAAAAHRQYTDRTDENK